MSKEINPKRRNFLFTTTYSVGAIGVGAAIWPLVDQMNPDTSVKAVNPFILVGIPLPTKYL